MPMSTWEVLWKDYTGHEFGYKIDADNDDLRFVYLDDNAIPDVLSGTVQSVFRPVRAT